MSLLNFDIQTMQGLLIWVILSSLILVLAYVYGTRNAGDKQFAHSIILAKSLLVIAFLLIKHNSGLPRLLSLNLAYSLVLCGALTEARAILYIIDKHHRKTTVTVTIITFVGIIAYNISIFLWPDSFARTSIGATVLIATLVAPTIQLLIRRDPFKLIVGLSYTLYIALMLPNGVFFLFNHDISPDMESALRSLNLLALILLSTFNLPAFLLLMKEDADKRLRELAHTDFLTKLNNRQSFFETTHPMFCRHQREETPCGIIFIDIDDFKRINDTHGHAFGDEVIRTVASILKSMIRGYDIPCRFGGEEFACFINNVEQAAIHALAERIRTMISTTTFQAKPDFNFTISIGVAAGVPGPQGAVDTFIDVADKALYEAKKSGRNRVVVKPAS